MAVKMPATKTDFGQTKRNPFDEPPLPRSFYHPSSSKILPKDKRNTALSPDPNKRNTAERETSGKIPEEEEMFLSGSHVFSNTGPAPSPHDSSSKFEESWASSERPSLGEDLGKDARYDFDRFLNLKKRLDFPERDSQHGSFNNLDDSSGMRNEGSTLAKYVERFRKGAPQSREERQLSKGRSVRDFWWLDTKSPPEKQMSHKATKARSPVSPYRVTSRTDRLTAATLATHLSSRLPGDEDTQRLQEKADRLLEQSVSTECSSGPVVSTEGLGSSPSSVDTERSTERSVRPAFTRHVRDSSPLIAPPPPLQSAPLRPEDDILYQWRLRRRMEQAQDTAHLAPRITPHTAPQAQQTPTASKLSEFREKLARFSVEEPMKPSPPAPTSHTHSTTTAVPQVTPTPTALQEHPTVHAIPSKPDGLVREKETTVHSNVAKSPIASPSLHRKQSRKAKEGDLEPHLHLMCDILPCPHQAEYRNTAVITDSSDSEDGSSPVPYKQYLQAEKPDTDQRSKKTYTQDRTKLKTSGGGKHRHIKQDQQSFLSSDLSHEKSLSKDTGKSYKLTSGKTSTERNSKQRDDRQMETKSTQGLSSRSREATGREVRSRSPVIPSSKPPVDSAIGQVVKGFLFESSQSVTSSMDSMAASSNISDVTQGVEESLHDEGSTSDGEEFSDDSLLQHLRQQRSLYEAQLREIDEILAEQEWSQPADN